MRHRFLAVLTAIALLFSAQMGHAKPVILASLKPLALIAQELTGSLAEVDTLLPDTASHHDYPLKVSDHARLQKADVIVWIGPELESFLQKPLANLPSAKIIASYDLPGIQWPADDHSVQHSDHTYEHDPHLWLDPRNAIVVAQALTAKLVLIDAVNAKQYQANLQLFNAKMQSLDESLRLSLKSLAGIGFAVYHEGFSHFVGRYGLHQLDYVTFTPEQKPGAKHLHQLRGTLAKEGKCLFLEPYNDTQAVRDLAQELHLRLGVLDALGVQGAKNYTQLLTQMAEAFSACLTDGRNQ
jgi:zinc transport system substrate-binding protein